MSRLGSLLIAIGVALGLAAPTPLAAQETIRSHGWAIHGSLKYPDSFPHFDYVNPEAPKGGSVVFGAAGTFDSLNPFILKGNPAQGASDIYDTLMVSSRDEANSEYGLLAERLEVDVDADGIYTAIRFYLRAEARFHDEEPVRADDVVWSFNALREKGRPFFGFYYGNVVEAIALDDRTVEFRLSPGENKEMPLTLGQVPVMPRHYWEGRDFEAATLEPPLGSGPYRIRDVRPGESLTLERVPDYWAANLPVNRGHHNFDVIRYDYYRDRVVMLEALKGGEVDFRRENSAKFWATAYDVPAVKEGRLLQREFSHGRSTGMQAFVMNTRKPVFQDPRVREAMTYLWDFEWVNRNIMYEAYARTDSYFENSYLEADGLPGPAELAVLEPLRGDIPVRALTQRYSPPATDGTGNNRESLRRAMNLMREAGWEIQDGILTHTESGIPFRFEILLTQDLLVPHSQALVRGVERIGGQAIIPQPVDAAQYQSRLDTYDFDVVVSGWGQSLSPGNEQREYWGSAAALRDGSRNLSGIQSNAIDTLIEALIASPDRETLIERTRALDRVLSWSFLGIPMFHTKTDRLAYWNRFGIPDEEPMLGTSPDFWWIDPERDAVLDGRAN